MPRILFVLCTLALLWACTVAKTNLNDTKNPKNARIANTEFKYEPIRSKFLLKGADSIRVYNYFMDPGIETASEFISKYGLAYAFILDYSAKDKSETRVLNIDEENVSVKNGQINFYFDLKKPKTELISIVLKIELNARNGAVKSLNEITVRLNSIRTSDNYALFDGDFVVLKNYAALSDTLMLKSLSGESRTFNMVQYVHDFDYAMSPVVVGQRISPKPLYVDSIIPVATNQKFVIGRKVLCSFIKDTTDRTGISLLTVDERFPKYTKPEDLVKPLAYISTNQEYRGLSMSADAKKALDQYWLSLHNGNQITAKRSIKQLYQKVNEANQLFTGYKEGWKTDKGMIYIVMGYPDVVRFTKDKEIWAYTHQAKFSEVNFTFSKRPNQFIEDHYELNRFADFQQVWFPAVDAIRTGANLQ